MIWFNLLSPVLITPLEACELQFLDRKDKLVASQGPGSADLGMK